MKYKVIQTFKDKNTMERFEAGAVYETDENERAQELIEKGYIAAAPKARKKEAE